MLGFLYSLKYFKKEFYNYYLSLKNKLSLLSKTSSE